MRIKGHTLGAWLNRKRFAQRKAKGYALSKRFDHRLLRWLSRPLFKLLPPKWYLRTQGIRLPDKQDITVTITYHRQDKFLLVDKRQMLVKLNGVNALDRMIFLWFEYGFCEPVPELSPYIPHHLDNRRYYIPPANILKMEWYDPVLKEDISIDGPYWRPA